MLSLMREETICNDLHLLVSFHKYFLFHHFAFLQKGDPNCDGTPNFISHHLALRYYYMLSDFLMQVKQSIVKYFSNWVNSQLLIFALFDPSIIIQHAPAIQMIAGGSNI
mmetsp:Transcript_18747/g.26403  ORF Transcript_18747/g.26403 Transcript_18747/m.26403 type:complete len:109 (+) Transcript_18747:198-524(+)